MLISEAIDKVRALTGQVFDDEILKQWLSELDGRLATEFFGVDFWRNYCLPDPEDEGSEEEEAELAVEEESGDSEDPELLVPHPWDGGIYLHWLAAQTYLANGEYDRYENERVYAETQIDEYKKHITRTMPSACEMMQQYLRERRCVYGA